MSATETKTVAGRILKARWLAGEDVRGISYIGIGQGDWVDKNNPPPVSASATGLVNELARKQVQRTAWLEEDVNGAIAWNGKRYKETPTETPIVAMFADFTADEANGFQICEEGVFAGDVETLVSPYALASEVVAPGVLYWVRNRPAYPKVAGDVFTAIAVWEEK